MDSWEFNKIAGAVIGALLIAFGAGTLAEIMHSGHGKTVKAGYELPVTVSTGGSTAAAAPAAFNFADVAPLLKAASAENGRNVFAPCRACHTADKDGKTLVGPNLYGVVGHKIGVNAGFPRYSAAMKGQAGEWSFDKLAAYLHDPRGAIPGNQMAYQGVKNNSDLADLLVYLRSLSDSPVPLPN